MRIRALVLLLAGLTTDHSIQARERERDVIAVCVTAGGPVQFLNRAELIASSIYGLIGVGIRWFNDRQCPAAAIQITLTYNRPSIFEPSAYAYALPYEGTKIEVFANRLEQVPESRRVFMLGHVLAHEIGHILQGVARHSASGLMKASWGAYDYSLMDRRLLSFADLDVSLIRAGLAHRRERLLAMR